MNFGKKIFKFVTTITTRHNIEWIITKCQTSSFSQATESSLISFNSNSIQAMLIINFYFEYKLWYYYDALCTIKFLVKYYFHIGEILLLLIRLVPYLFFLRKKPTNKLCTQPNKKLVRRMPYPKNKSISYPESYSSKLT